MFLMYARVALVCLVLFAFAGCGGGDNTTTSNVPPSKSLSFTLTTTKAAFTAGENVPLTFTVKNTGTRTASIFGGGCLLWFRITQGATTVAGIGGCIDAGWTFDLAPGQTKVYNDSWNQRDLQGAQVPPGQYTVKYWLPAGRINDGVTDENLTFAQSEQDLAATAIQVTVQ